jgi:hypothetical protein
LRGICQVETGVDRANWEIDVLDLKTKATPPLDGIKQGYVFKNRYKYSYLVQKG